MLVQWKGLGLVWCGMGRARAGVTDGPRLRRSKLERQNSPTSQQLIGSRQDTADSTVHLYTQCQCHTVIVYSSAAEKLSDYKCYRRS